MGQEVAKVKKILRQQIREAMAELTDQERAWSDGELIQRFLEHPKLAEAHTVLLYYGVGQEVATAGLIQTLLDQGKTVCLPKCLPEYQMEARAITALEDLVPDQYDIPAPKDGCPVVAREELDLILVPGLCFDSRGSRLARAAGTMTATWRTMRGSPSACAGRISSRSTCPGSLWMPGCGSSSPRRARCGP